MRASASLVLLTALLASACEPSEPPPNVEPPPPLATPYEVAPATCDAGVVEIGALGVCELVLTNITEVDVTMTGATSGAPFIVQGAVGPLPVGESVTISVTAIPAVVGVIEGELSLGPGRLVIPLRVEGIDGGDEPTAVIEVSPADVVVGDEVTLDGAASGPDIVGYAWTLEQRPVGSAVTLAFDGTTATFVPDLAGEFVVGLEVTAAEGTASATQGVSVRDPRDVTLTTSAGVLHLRPAAEALCGPLDCFAGSCTDIVWGGPRSTPTAAGGGIVIDDLALGTFRATVVHDGSATVSAFVQGALITEAAATVAAGDAHDAFDLVVTAAGVSVTDLSATVPGGACP